MKNASYFVVLTMERANTFLNCKHYGTYFIVSEVSRNISGNLSPGAWTLKEIFG